MPAVAHGPGIDPLLCLVDGEAMLRENKISRRSANFSSMHDEDLPADIDFFQAVRGLHHIPNCAKVFVPTSIEREVWEYFSKKGRREVCGSFRASERRAEGRH